MSSRSLSKLDRIIDAFDQALRTVYASALPARPSPAQQIPESDLGPEERALSGRLMRVNHAGEVCAQALYQGHALAARSPEIKEKMTQAAREENDHLAWTEGRINELAAHKSLLNPVWYAGSFFIGAASGLASDRWSLGFVAETEKQVVAHLTGHLRRLPVGDEKSQAILRQMRAEEGLHATSAIERGGISLPAPIRKLMRLASSVMVRVAYWI